MMDMSQARNIPVLGVGMLGYAFMGKAHSNAYKTQNYIYDPPPAYARLVAIAGRNAERVEAARRRFGYEKAYTNWQQLVNDPDIDLLDNGATNDVHAEPCIAAAEAGKHILCEKPLGRNADEARRMLEAVRKAGVVHMCAFNYRFVPAVALAHKIIRNGRLGQIYQFRAQFIQEKPNPFPGGALLDQGTHLIDLARFLVGEITSVTGSVKTFISTNPVSNKSGSQNSVDDAWAAIFTFENGAMGTIETTRLAKGQKMRSPIEVYGSKGAIAFDQERLNELQVYLPEEEEPKDAQGYRRVVVTEWNHPYFDAWWPPGHTIGWEHTFIHEIKRFFEAIVTGGSIRPEGADFEDGYRVSVVADAIIESSQSGRRIQIHYE
jgi:predicted dehydrogenase